jgi:Recombinase zinc beta ribbon domain
MQIKESEPDIYLLSSRIICACTTAMVGQRNRNGKTDKLYYYYRCNSEFGKKGKCGMSKWHSDEVDETVWQFAMELISDPERLIQGYRTMQVDEREHFDSVGRQIRTLDEEIGKREEELSSLVDQRTQAKAPTLQAILDQKLEEYAGIIDNLKARREALLTEQGQEPLTDAEVQAMVSELTALRQMNEALATINETADFTAKRALIDLLDLHVQIRIDEEDQKWVDITWASKLHQRKLWIQKESSLKGSRAPT